MLGDQQRRTARGELAERLADEARPGRVQLGGRLVEDHVARPHRQQRCDADELRLAAGQPGAGRGAGSTRCGAAPGRPRVRSTVSATRRPRFIGPSATSSKTVPAIPDRWVFGFWKPTPTRVANSWVGLPAIGSPSIESVPVSVPPIDAGARPGGDETERRLAGLVGPTSPTISPSASVRSISWRRWWRSRRIGMSPLSSSTGRQGVAGTRRRSCRRSARPARGPAARGERSRRSPASTRAGGAARPAERPDLEREAALLDLGERGEDHRPNERQDAAQSGPTLPSVSSPRARWTGLDHPARSTIAGTASSVARATNANRGDSRAARGRGRTRAGPSSARTGRSTSRSRTAGRASGRRSRRPRASRRTGRS